MSSLSDYSLKSMRESIDRTFKDLEDRLDEITKGVEIEGDGTETTTVVEETHPDGTRVVTKTVVRRITKSVTK